MAVPLARLPPVAPGQNPNLSKAYPVLDFVSGNPDIGRDNDEVFENFHTDFVMHVSGFLNITEAKEYEFRFTANNGGRLTLDGEEFANGHYYEGTYRKTFKVTLDAGAYLLENAMVGDSEAPKLTKIADGLSEPLGIVEAKGEIYVLQRWELTQLVDNDGDGITDEYRVVADDWGATADFHEWSFGLEYREGFFYAALDIAQGKFARVQSPDRGTVIKIAMDGTHSFMAHGLREPNGVGFGPDGELFSSDNEGEWLPANKFVHIRKDVYTFFGHRGKFRGDVSDLEDMPPALWLPLTEIANSPTQPVTLHHGPYEGQMIYGDVTHGGIKRVFLEKVAGEYQGAVFRFAQGLEAGILRMDWGPDGSLYVAGLGSVQDFSHKGHQFGLERLTYNGKPTFEMLAVRAKANGMEIEFTEPLRAGDGEFPEDYFVQQWWYKPSGDYGGAKRDLENLAIRSVTLSPDRA